jgi:hypothetical protein
VLHVKIVLIALIAGAFAASPAEATLYDFTIKGGFTGSGTFTTSDTSIDLADPDEFLVTAMTGTFNGSKITQLDPINTLFADNVFDPSGLNTQGLYVDDDGWTWHAGSRDYNMFLSDGTDSHGNPTENLLIGYPGISGGSKKVTFAVTEVESVPEPATLGLFGISAIGLGLTRRRQAA